MWKVKTSWGSRSKSDAKAQRKWGTYFYNLNVSLKFLSFYSLVSTVGLDHTWKPKDGLLELLWEWSPSTNVSHVRLPNLPASSLIILITELQSGGWVLEKHPGASSIRSQPLDGDCTPWPANLSYPANTPPCSMGETQAPFALIKSVEKGVRGAKR